MKIAEKILVVLVSLSLILKMFHIPGGAMISILLTFFLALFYVGISYLLFKSDDTPIVVDGFLQHKTNTFRVLGGVATGISLSTTILGILFKTMRWPGATALLIIGLFSLLVISIVSIIKYSKNKSSFYKNLLLRVSGIGGVGLIMLLLMYQNTNKWKTNIHS